MATREDLISGIEMVIREGRRVAADLSEEQWSHAVDQDGWKSKEVLAHVAAVGTIVVPMVNGLVNAAPGADSTAGIDINALNASFVAQRAGKTIPELADELASAYGTVIDFVKRAPDDVLARKATISGYADVPLSDILVRMVVLHGLAHIYSAYSAVFNAVRAEGTRV